MLDNDATHKPPLVRRWFTRDPRYHLHVTPTSDSWLNLVERWFVDLTRKQITRGRHCRTRFLREAIRQYIERSNTTPHPFVWTQTADDILESVPRFCTRISESQH